MIYKQINYIFDENKLLEKSSNSTFRLIFNGIKKLNKSKKHLKIKIKIMLLFGFTYI